MITSIRIKRSTKAILDEIGSKGDTYDSIVAKVANEFVGNRQ